MKPSCEGESWIPKENHPFKQIESSEDVKVLIDCFFERALKDELLSPIFHARAKEIPDLKVRICLYWNQLVFKDTDDVSLPILQHVDLGLSYRHFVQWITLFQATIDDLYTGANAQRLHLLARTMSEELQRKMHMRLF